MLPVSDRMRALQFPVAPWGGLKTGQGDQHYEPKREENTFLPCNTMLLINCLNKVLQVKDRWALETISK